MGSYTISYLMIVVFMVLLGTPSASYTSPTWTSTSLIQTGQKDIVINNVFQNSNLTAYYTITYSPSFTSPPYSSLGVIAFQAQSEPCYAIKFKVIIEDYYNYTTMKIKMVYYDQMSYKTFRVSYMAADSSLSAIKIIYYQLNTLSNQSVASGYGSRTYSKVDQLGSIANTSHTYSVISFIVGLDVTSITGEYILGWSSAIISSTQISYTLVVDKWTYVNQIFSYIMTFDKTDGELQQYIFLDTYTYTTQNTNPTFFVFNSTINFHVGISSFSISSTMFSYSKSSRSISGAAYAYLRFDSWSFRLRGCPVNTRAYYLVNTNLCYDVCPSGYFNYETPRSKYCPTCSYFMFKCLTCSNVSFCNSCSSPFIPSPGNSSCMCPSNYYATGTTCSLCHFTCLTCVSNLYNNCTGCNLNYRTFDGVAKTCNCLRGARANLTCYDECSVTQFYDIVTNSCVTTCPSGRYKVNETYRYCQNCSDSINQCSACSSATNCTACSSGYSISNGICICAASSFINSTGSCVACSFTCLTCSSVSTLCLTCNTLYRNLNGTACVCNVAAQANGTCVDECTVAKPYFNPANNSCLASCPAGTLVVGSASYQYCATCSSLISNCFSCSSTTNCTACQSAYTPSNGICVCVSGNYINSSGSCLACSSTCLSCISSSSQCTTCNTLYRNLSGTSCICKVSTRVNGSCIDQCYNPQPYYYSLTSQCHSSCPNGSLSTSTPYLQCLSCWSLLPKCTSCISSAICTSCQPAFVLSNGSCVCPTNGYFLNSSGNCNLCLPTCLTCSNANQCASCDTSIRTLNATACVCNLGTKPDGNCKINCTSIGCVQCQISVNKCQACTTTFQLQYSQCTCPNYYYLNATQQKCIACYPTCLTCNGILANQCTQCNSLEGRILSNNTCVCSSVHNELSGKCVKSSTADCTEGYYKGILYCEEICGDGKLIELDCDDGNLIDGDGCNSQCKIQANYSCIRGSLTSKSNCSFNGIISFQVTKAIKNPYQNKIAFFYQIKPFLQFFKTYDMTNSIKYTYSQSRLLQTSSPTINVLSTTYDPESKSLIVQIQFFITLNLKTIQLIFIPPSTESTFAIQTSTENWRVQPTNNLAAVYYPESTYNNVQIIRYIYLYLQYLALVVSFLCLFFRKMLALQLMSLFQICFLSFSMVSYSQPQLGPILEWKYIFGYNSQKVSSGDILPLTNNFQQMGFEREFGQSCNYMLLLLLLLYMISLILFTLSQFSNKTNSKKLRQIFNYVIFDICLGISFFLMMDIIISIILEIQASSFTSFANRLSKCYQLLAIVFASANAVMVYYHAETSSQNHCFYSRQFRSAKYHPFILLIRNIVIVMLIWVYIVYHGIYMGMILLQVLYMLIVLVMNPYQKIIDKYRFIIGQVSVLYILISRSISGTISDLQNNRLGGFLSCNVYIEVSLLAVSFTLTTSSFIYHLYRSRVDAKVYPQTSQDQLKQETMDKYQLKDFMPMASNAVSPSRKDTAIVIEQLDGQKQQRPSKVDDMSLEDLLSYKPQQKSIEIPGKNNRLKNRLKNLVLDGINKNRKST